MAINRLAVKPFEAREDSVNVGFYGAHDALIMGVKGLLILYSRAHDGRHILGDALADISDSDMRKALL